MDVVANTIPQAAVGSKANPVVTAMMREVILGQDPAGYMSNCRVIAGAKPPEYGKVQQPVLIIVGEEDKSAPLEAVEKMFSEIGAAVKKLAVLDGVGHWQCLEAPEEVCKHILKFYKQI